jgi:hypothetical protein
MTIKNTQKIALAEEVVAHARSLGFEHSFLIFTDEDGYTFDRLEELAQENSCESDTPITVSINIVLDEDLNFFVVEYPGDENAEPRIELAK